ncbi:F-box/FBD/LRR-repeat protein At1g13570-like [Rutidosis leptorrhynchoides]|uniref:F-box/FBD/LRR-repeat protein At1g13570-like n=1 Tax=Rutidosis leptorrhynchoides TaxID=125765 RepID=UPI003A99554B
MDHYNINARRLSLDRISNLPLPIIETILSLLPTKVAVRTSILSREWRYHWTKIPELFFDEDAFKGSSDQLSILEQTFYYSCPCRRCNFFKAIYQVLLLHKGPLLEFSLITSADMICDELDLIISHLSRRNTVKIFSLDLNEYSKYRLPLSFFSLNQLTNLDLHKVCIHHPPTFNGFGSLTSLYLHNIKISPKTLVHLVSNCPVLKSLTLFIDEDNTLGNGNDVSSSFSDLIKCLPVIECLVTSLWVSHVS